MHHIMKRSILAVLAGLLLALSAHAQVVVMDSDMFERNRNIKVKMNPAKNARVQNAMYNML